MTLEEMLKLQEELKASANKAPKVITPSINTPSTPSVPTANKNIAPVTTGAEVSEEDALRLNMGNNGSTRIIGKAIDKQYEKLDDYNFGEKALNDALSIAQQNSQNVWDEDLLRLQRLQNNRNDLLSYMTPVQQMQYSRVPDNKKKDYLDAIMAELQTKKGIARANEIRNMEDSTNRDLQKIALSVESGGEGFKTGLKGAYNLLRGANETVAKGASEYAFEELRPETTGALGVAMDLGNTVGNVAPSIALGLVGGPLGVGALGTAAMGVSSAGKGYDSAIGEGYTPEQATTYGVASGVSEALLQRIAGALPGVSNAKGFVTRALGKYGDDVLLKVAKNPSLAKGLLTVLGNAVSEGTEEGAQEIIDTFIRNAVLGEDKDINWKDVGYSALLGAATGGAFAVPSGVNAYRDMQGRVETDKRIKNDLIQESLLNQKAEAPTKKNESPISTNFSQNVEQDSNAVADTSSNTNVGSINFGQNTVGSAQYDPDSLQAKVDEYGAIPQGEGPVARVSQIPVQIDDSGAKTSRFVRTAVEAKPTTETMAGEIEQGVNKGDFRYIPTTNKELADRAAKHIEKAGFKGALEGWNYKIDNEKILTPDDIAIAEQLYNAASNAGDTKTAYKILGDLTAYGSMYGQAIEALRILKTLGPDAKLYHLEGVKNLLNKEINLGTLKAVNKDLGVTLNEELVDKMMNAETEEEANRYLDEIEQDMANQVKVGFYEAVQEFRYLMMLANPQTHSRNIVGNLIMQPAVKIKNIIGAGLESKIGTNKTKSVRAGKDARAFAKADYESVRDHFKEDNKYTMRNDILRKRTVFKGKAAAPLEALRKLNSKALSGEDNFFKGVTYRDSLAGYMEANGHTAEYYNSPEGANDLAKAREYAMNEALKATYQDANELANILNNLERKNAVGKVVVGGLLPFKKTPLNILKRGVEYSPVGILNGIKDLKKASNNGDIKNASQAVDKLAAGLTGTGIMALGFVLRNMGALSGSYDEDEEIARLQQAQGKQEYALNIAGHTLDLSQFSPVAMPLLVGAQLSDIVNKEGWDSAAALEALGRIADPIVDTSMLSGIGDALNTFSYGGDAGDALSSFATSSIKNYATSFVPTFGGKVAKTKDPVQRSTYVDKNSEVPKTIQQILMSSKQKIPGAYSSLEPTLDIWGRETRNDSFASRVFNNFANPSTTKTVKETDVDKEVQRVYEQTGTSGVIPKKPDKYVTYKGNRKDYTAKEYTQLVKGRNGQSLLDLEVMFNDPLYSALSEEEKAEAIKDVYEYNGIKAKESIGGYSSDNDKKIDELKDAGGFTTAQAILLKQAVSNAAEGGNTLSNKTKKLQTNFIQSLDLTAEQKQVLEDTLVSDWTIIGNDTSRAYTSGKGDANNESYVLSGLGKEANKAWPKLKNGGMSIGRLEEVASIMSSSTYPKKADKINALMKEFGYNSATATYIYGAFKNK